MKRVCVLGGGSFGTALADLCARRGHDVWQWVRHPARAKAINTTHRNPDYVSEFDLAPTLRATADPEEALHQSHWCLLAVPTPAVRPTLELLRTVRSPIPLVLAAKGIENESLMTLSEVVLDVLGPAWQDQVLALSGPSFAREIMQRFPTAVVLASRHEGLADAIGKALFCDYFRAYSSTDLVGVEMAGALKNVIAIATGGAAGLGLGHNSRAALITRGLAEITRFAVAKGANPLTVAGLAGVGDLVLTCTGDLSRNRTVGRLLGEGKTLAEATAIVREVAEGVRTTRSAHALAQQLGVDARITRVVYQVLYEDQPVREGLNQLVRRAPGPELEH